MLEGKKASFCRHYSCSVTPSQQPTISGKGEKSNKKIKRKQDGKSRQGNIIIGNTVSKIIRPTLG